MLIKKMIKIHKIYKHVFKKVKKKINGIIINAKLLKKKIAKVKLL